MPLVVTLKFYMEFQKDRFRGLYLKIVVTYFFDMIEIVILQVMRMIIRRISLILVWTM